MCVCVCVIKWWLQWWWSLNIIIIIIMIYQDGTEPNRKSEGMEKKLFPVAILSFWFFVCFVLSLRVCVCVERFRKAIFFSPTTTTTMMMIMGFGGKKIFGIDFNRFFWVLFFMKINFDFLVCGSKKKVLMFFFLHFWLIKLFTFVYSFWLDSHRMMFDDVIIWSE